jgi:16S rRNA (cytidine1402-2'-O)-methyltransferase
MPSFTSKHQCMPLVLIPTPLGNLRDITLRALEMLRDADHIVAEDTRVTRKLLHAHGIAPRSLSPYNEYTGEPGVEAILAQAADRLVVVVTDAGMPGISDPGSALLVLARARAIPVEVLPGPVAFVAAIVLSGFPTTGLSFEGFVPRGEGKREKAFLDSLKHGRTSAWYEAPHRIEESIATLERIASDLPIFVLREYTKKFEQQVLGTPSEVLAALPKPMLGECVLVLDGQSYRPPTPENTDVDARIDALLAEGRSPATIAKSLAADGAGSRNELYRRASSRGKQADSP